MRKKHFTFIEIVTVLGIISILVVICLPKINVLRAKYSQEKFIKSFNALIYDARLRTFEEKKEYSVIASTSEVDIVSEDGKYSGESINYPDTLKYEDESFAENKLTFTIDGSPKYSGSFIFDNNIENNKLVVKVEPASGKVDTIWLR